jgi:hypothetical protein
MDQEEEEEEEEVAGLVPTSTRTCKACGTKATPQWRRGPLGARTLCNACGVKYVKDQRAAANKVRAAQHALTLLSWYRKARRGILGHSYPPRISRSTRHCGDRRQTADDAHASTTSPLLTPPDAEKRVWYAGEQVAAVWHTCRSGTGGEWQWRARWGSEATGSAPHG